ncbi:MAG: hypothetical protein JXR66_02865, partial [Bacteroidales bacterium]|nr:hypothetical protein [Bacteroidales bacterium]
DTRNGDIIWTNKVEGDLKSAQYLNLTDSLCREIKDYLEIKALEQKTDYDFREAFPKSAEAYRYFIEGVNLILTSEYEAATLSLERALEIDSTFTLASFYMAFAYNVGRLSQAAEQTLKWVQKAYETKEEIPLKYQYWLELWYACMISQDPDDMLKYCNLLEKTGMESRILWFDLGITYIDFFRQYDKATDAFVRVEEINRERGNEWKYDRYYNEYCEALLLAGRPGEVKRIADLGLKVNPDNAWLIVYKGSSYALLGDTVSLRNTLSEIESYREKHNIPVVAVESGLGWMYYLAKDTARMEEHYRNAFILDPGNRNRAADLAWSLIRFNINPEEGLKMTEEVLENYPDLAWWIWMKGLALHRLGYHAEGLELLKQADEKYNTYNIELKNDIKEAEKAVESQI